MHTFLTLPNPDLQPDFTSENTSAQSEHITGRKCLTKASKLPKVATLGNFEDIALIYVSKIVIELKNQYIAK